MKGMAAIMLTLFVPIVAGSGKLSEDYLISYGSPEAPVQIVEYFSFSCPTCCQLFREDFECIRKTYLDTGQAYWLFHPVPVDLLTVQAMVCLSKLSAEKKRIFLEEILDEAAQPQPVDLLVLIEKVMEIFGEEIPDLKDMNVMEKTSAFEHAFLFLKAGHNLEGVPALEMNGRLIEGVLPSKSFIDLTVPHLLREVSQ